MCPLAGGLIVHLPAGSDNSGILTAPSPVLQTGLVFETEPRPRPRQSGVEEIPGSKRLPRAEGGRQSARNRPISGRTKRPREHIEVNGLHARTQPGVRAGYIWSLGADPES